MRHWAKIGLVAMLLLAACSSPKQSSDNKPANEVSTSTNARPAPVAPALSETDRQAVDKAVDAIYAPYRSASDKAEHAEMNEAIFASSTSALVKKWKEWVPEDEPGDIFSVLQEAGWFCQCQDWDGDAFKFLDKKIKRLPDDEVEATVRFDLGGGEAMSTRIHFVHEGKDWKVADLFTPALAKGLVAQIQDDLASWKVK